MTQDYIFSFLDRSRLADAMQLVRNVFMEFEAPEYSEEGIQEFMRFIVD